MDILDVAVTEFHKGLNRLWRKHVQSRYIHPDNRFVLMGNGSTNSSGDLIIPIGSTNQIPDGKTFLLYKLIQWADGKTPGVPYTDTDCSTYILHGPQLAPSNIADFAPNNGAGGTVQTFPLTAEYSSVTAPEFKSNDHPHFAVVSGPVSTNIFVMAYGELLSNSQIQYADTENDI